MSQNTGGIDALLKKYNGENTPGTSLMVIRDGKVLINKSYGYADLETGKKVNSSTNFRLASVSKQFTATCILLLVKDGKLTLEHPLTDVFPGFPDYGKNITIRHLLNHSSGIPDYEDYVDDTAFHPQIKDKGVLDIVIKSDKGYFQPGTEYRYSNTAYALLALMVEKYSGMPYREFLQEKIFGPLKMTGTIAFEYGINEVNHRAFGYSKPDGNWIRKDQSSTSAVLGDGGIYSNVEDLYKWDQALYSGIILPLSIIKESFTRSLLNNGQMFNYGYGWHLKKRNDEEVVYHTGSTTSFRNIFYRIPSQKLSIILLTNRDQPEEEEMVSFIESLIPFIMNSK